LTIQAKTIRYIKLGKRSGGWEDSSLNNGEIHFGYGGVSHEMALVGDVAEIKQQEIGKGKQPQVAASTAQQVHDFYHLGADCLWITFARDHLWWTFAEPEVVHYGPPTHDRGERMRKSIGGWRNTDINGQPLRIDSLSTKLTKVQFYQRTICGWKQVTTCCGGSMGWKNR
jgi:hypothetical protein